MKKIYNVLLSLFLMTMISSCLKAGLEELPAYEDADITNFKFEYRWFDDAKNRMCVIFIGSPEYIDSHSHLDPSGGLTIMGG